MKSLVTNGFDILELGVPFSDPMADGPTIQRAAERALANKVSLKDVLAVVAAFRQTDQETPVVLMGYLNPVHKMGYAEFARAAAEAGVDGVLTVDSPVETIAPLQRELQANGMDAIFWWQPTTSEARMQSLFSRQRFCLLCFPQRRNRFRPLGYRQVAAKIAVLRRHISLPIGVGFGISDAESAAKIGTRWPDAVIVGSRIVKEIEDNRGREAEAVGALAKTETGHLLIACFQIN